MNNANAVTRFLLFALQAVLFFYAGYRLAKKQAQAKKKMIGTIIRIPPGTYRKFEVQGFEGKGTLVLDSAESSEENAK